ncbi:MAG: DUF1559 domain-containing protein, partial [Chloroflexi bacterium]|nr:DUF1559 domain-containing protein [Chloroflexota bacterium]
MIRGDQLIVVVAVEQTVLGGLRRDRHRGHLSPHRSTPTPRSPAAGFFSSQIIAILAAILFPVFAKAREKARQTSCLSNMKQLGLATMQYTSDYDEMYPARWACCCQCPGTPLR